MLPGTARSSSAPALRSLVLTLCVVFASACQAQSDGAASVTTNFSPNATTISTSEGAPYSECDFWVTTPSSCGATNGTAFGYGPILDVGYGSAKVIRLYISLSGET